MTPDEINRRLAVECMGWKLDPAAEQISLLDWYTDADGKLADCVQEWNPYHSIADAMRVAEKIGEHCDTMIERERGEGQQWQVELFFIGSMQYSAAHASLPAAICLAALAWVEAREGAGDAGA